MPPQPNYVNQGITTGFGAIRPGDPAFVNGPSPVNNRYDQGTTNLTGAGSLKPHSSRIANSGKNIRCKFFTSDVGCRNGSNCPFWHQGDPIPQGGVVDFDPEIARMLKGQDHGRNDQRGGDKNRHRDDHYRR
jgi:hypothetical protein